MNDVTHVLLQFAGLGDRGVLDKPSDYENFDCVQAFTQRRFFGQEFKPLASLLRNTHTAAAAWGGSKVPECELWAGAFDSFSVSAFLWEIRQLSWRAPEALRILIQGPQHNSFGVWVMRDGDLVCSVDPT